MHSLTFCRRGAPTPRVDIMTCTSCGEQRDSKWFNSGKGPAGLQAYCMPCKALAGQQRRRRNLLECETRLLAAEKQCCKCEKTLPTTSFPKDSGNLDGLRNDCKQCHNKAKAALHMVRKERFQGQPPVAAAGEERICSACGTAKPWSEYYRRLDSAYGIGGVCKECHLLQVRHYHRVRSQTSTIKR